MRLGETMKKFVKNSIISTKFFIKDNTLTVIFITLFTVGTLIGSFTLYYSIGKSDSVSLLLKQYFDENSSLSILALFSRNVIASFFYLAVMYIGGLCAIGLPFVAIIPVIKGIAIGTIISYQYVYNGLKGFLYAMIILLIPAALLMAVLNLAYIEGMYMSLTVSNGIFNGKPRESKYNLSFMTFTKRFLIFSVGIVIICIIEAVLSSAFSSIL